MEIFTNSFQTAIPGTLDLTGPSLSTSLAPTQPPSPASAHTSADAPIDFLTPSVDFDYKDYYYNPQGQTVFFPNASPHVDPPVSQIDLSADFSKIVRDKYDPVDSPFFPPTQEDADRLVSKLHAMRKTLGTHANIEFFHGRPLRYGAGAGTGVDAIRFLLWGALALAMFFFLKNHFKGSRI